MIPVVLTMLLLAAPQDPPVLGLVTAPDSRPLADAEVVLQRVSGTQLALLRGLGTVGETNRTRTDHRGRYRLEGHGPGVLLVRHGEGLGAISQVYPGAPRRMIAEPLAALVSAGEPLRAWLRLIGPGLEGTTLPVQQGGEIRLPAGPYQVWVEESGRLEFHRLALASGKEYSLSSPAEPEQFVQLWEGFRGQVSPHSWPEVSLVQGSSGLFAVPRGASRLEIREEIPGGHAFTEAWHPMEPALLRLEQPERRAVAVEVRTPAGEPVPGAEVWGLGATAQGAQPLCRVVTDPQGNGILALPAVPNVLLLAWHSDWAAGGTFLEDAAPTATLMLANGRDVTVSVEAPTGPGPLGARLELEPSAGTWGTLVAYTDDRGLARFHRVPPGPALVRLRDMRFLPDEGQVSGNRIRFQARLGNSLEGRAVLPSGGPALRALITLREPDGTERTIATDDRGRFRFTGLGTEGSLVLFASLQVDGATYSRRISGLRPGETNRLVELRLEDPVPPHRRNRRGRNR